MSRNLLVQVWNCLWVLTEGSWLLFTIVIAGDADYYVCKTTVLVRKNEWWTNLYTPDSDLTVTYFTLADSLSRGLYTVVRLVTHNCSGGLYTLSHCRQCGKDRQYECNKVRSSTWSIQVMTHGQCMLGIGVLLWLLLEVV